MYLLVERKSFTLIIVMIVGDTMQELLIITSTKLTETRKVEEKSSSKEMNYRLT